MRDDDADRYERTAEAAGMTLSEWARQALREAQRKQSSGDVERKLAALRRAVSYNFPPEPDIDTLLAEMEAGRLAEIEQGLGTRPPTHPPDADADAA